MLYYLTRYTLNGLARYYKILISPNLFGEFYVLREFGNIAYKNPTRVIEKTFTTQKEAEVFCIRLLRIKKRKGYR